LTRAWKQTNKKKKHKKKQRDKHTHFPVTEHPGTPVAVSKTEATANFGAVLPVNASPPQQRTTPDSNQAQLACPNSIIIFE
jgi:hypothetical protein